MRNVHFGGNHSRINVGCGGYIAVVGIVDCFVRNHVFVGGFPQEIEVRKNGEFVKFTIVVPIHQM